MIEYIILMILELGDARNSKLAIIEYLSKLE